MTDHDWHHRARCRHEDPDLFFPIGYRTPTCWRQINTAARVCLDCPVRRQCLDYALADPGLDGVWAGSTPAQRDFIRRRQGYRPRPRRVLTTPERRQRVHDLHLLGMSQREIGAELGISQQLVCYDLAAVQRESA